MGIRASRPRGSTPKQYYSTHIRMMSNLLGRTPPNLKGKTAEYIYSEYKSLKEECKQRGKLK